HDALRISDAVARGAEIIDDTVVSLECEGHVLRGVRGTERHYAAGAVVVAAGAWSGRIAGLPRPLSVEPVRGQLAAWPWPDGASPVIAYGERCYLLRRGDALIAGATMEHTGFDAGTNDATLD